MNGHESAVDQVERLVRERVRRTGLPCMVLAPETLSASDAVRVHGFCRRVEGPLEVLLAGRGGHLDAAYSIARSLGRRDGPWSVLVPYLAKSALTLIAVAAPDLVVGDLGELGPLDAQSAERQKADFPIDRSCLELFAGLDNVQEMAQAIVGRTVGNVLENTQLAAAEVCRIAAEAAAGILRPILEGVDPQDLGRRSRVLALGRAYVARVVDRFRPELPAELGEQLAERLVAGYPAHGFALDREELLALGLPVRAPGAEDAPWFDAVAEALAQLEPAEGLGEPELVLPERGGAGCRRAPARRPCRSTPRSPTRERQPQPRPAVEDGPSGVDP